MQVASYSSVTNQYFKGVGTKGPITKGLITKGLHNKRPNIKRKKNHYLKIQFFYYLLLIFIQTLFQTTFSFHGLGQAYTMGGGAFFLTNLFLYKLFFTKLSLHGLGRLGPLAAKADQGSKSCGYSRLGGRALRIEQAQVLVINFFIFFILGLLSHQTICFIFVIGPFVIGPFVSGPFVRAFCYQALLYPLHFKVCDSIFQPRMVHLGLLLYS